MSLGLRMQASSTYLVFSTSDLMGFPNIVTFIMYAEILLRNSIKHIDFE